MKYVTTMILSEHAHYETFCHEEPWESKHLLDATRRTQCILDFHNDKSDLHQLASKTKKIADGKSNALHYLLYKYEFLFEGT